MCWLAAPGGGESSQSARGRDEEKRSNDQHEVAICKALICESSPSGRTAPLNFANFETNIPWNSSSSSVSVSLSLSLGPSTGLRPPTRSVIPELHNKLFDFVTITWSVKFGVKQEWKLFSFDWRNGEGPTTWRWWGRWRGWRATSQTIRKLVQIIIHQLILKSSANVNQKLLTLRWTSSSSSIFPLNTNLHPQISINCGSCFTTFLSSSFSKQFNGLVRGTLQRFPATKEPQ